MSETVKRNSVRCVSVEFPLPGESPGPKRTPLSRYWSRLRARMHLRRGLSGFQLRLSSWTKLSPGLGRTQRGHREAESELELGCGHSRLLCQHHPRRFSLRSDESTMAVLACAVLEDVCDIPDLRNASSHLALYWHQIDQKRHSIVQKSGISIPQKKSQHVT